MGAGGLAARRTSSRWLRGGAAGQSARALPVQPPKQQRPGRVSVRLIAGAPVALVDHARVERPGLDQVQRDVFGDRRQERRAATDDDRIAEHAELVDEAELDRLPGSRTRRQRTRPRVLHRAAPTEKISMASDRRTTAPPTFTRATGAAVAAVTQGGRGTPA